MRVAIDYTAAIYQAAGIGRFVRSLVRALAEIDPDTEYLLVYADPPQGIRPAMPEAPNFIPRRIPLPERALAAMWHRLSLPVPVDLVTGPVDVFHSPDFVLPPVRRGAKVLTVHDLAFLLQPECAEAKLRDYLEKTVPRSVARADFILADSVNTQDDLICLLGVPPSKVEVVPGGVESTFVPVEDEDHLDQIRQRVSGGAPFVLSVGMIEPRKNLVRLIEAFEQLKERYHAPHKLVMAGKKGWLSDGIYRRAESSPVAADILFPGFVAEAELPALYSASDLFAYPSLYEGFGLPPLEAMACGTPVVASSSSSLPEVVGDAALLVDPQSAEQLSEAMVTALSDSGLRQRMRAKGLDQAGRFTWRSSAEKTLDVYRRLCASR
ncbi:MAG: glycosyltransferase family 4 protein [Chloroflexota bacterium]